MDMILKGSVTMLSPINPFASGVGVVGVTGVAGVVGVAVGVGVSSFFAQAEANTKRENTTIVFVPDKSGAKYFIRVLIGLLLMILYTSLKLITRE